MQLIHIVAADQRRHDAVIQGRLMQLVIVERKPVIQAAQFGPSRIDDIVMPQKNRHAELAQVDVVQPGTSHLAEVGEVYGADIRKPTEHMLRQSQAPRRNKQCCRTGRIGERSYGSG